MIVLRAKEFVGAVGGLYLFDDAAKVTLFPAAANIAALQGHPAISYCGAKTF